MKIIS
jgi:hypothetical protein